MMYKFLFLCLIVNVDMNYGINIKISSGKIQGQNMYSKVINKSYYSFRGIPYAEPPIGKLRFLPPVKVSPWDGVLETKKDGSQCLQRTGGSEDCLFLNVFTPVIHYNYKTSNLLPVMIYIHEGMFSEGSSNSSLYGPDYLIDKNIVLVTFNYRLGIFGFLNAMEESAPGNIGLKDQVAAFKWVQENIEKFSGNPKQVTIFGQSAGAASVQYHLQSNLSKGLFHKGIMQSGSTLNSWSFEPNPIDVLHIVGRILNIDSTNTTEFINKLKTLPSQHLLEASMKKELLKNNNNFLGQRLIPSLEYDGPNAFITENSYSLLRQNKVHSVPCIIGQVSNEVPISLNILNDTKRERAVLKEIMKEYFEHNVLVNKDIAHFLGDDTIIRGVRKTVDFLKNNNIFYYVIDYQNKTEKSIVPGLGMEHTGELKYLFQRDEDNYEENILIRDRLTILWTNFVKTGNPTPYKDNNLNNIIWPVVPTQKSKFKYLYIDGNLKIKTHLWQKNFKFWERIFKKYGKPPFNTY